MKKQISLFCLLIFACAAISACATTGTDWQLEPAEREFKNIPIGFGWGRPPSRTEKRIGGLVFSAGHLAGSNDFPRLRAMTHGNVQPFEYDNIWTIGTHVEMDLDLGQVAPLEAQKSECRIEKTDADWAHATVLYSARTGGGKNCRMELTVSRLTPAVLVRSSERGIGFLMNCNRKYTSNLQFAAFPAKDGVKTIDLTRELLPTSEMAEPWVLVWFAESIALDCRRTPYGPKYKANYPLLFVFSEPPDELGLDNGLSIGCAEALEERDEGLGYSVAVVPLFGDDFPRQEDVARWTATGLPEQIRQRCAWWSRALEVFPISARESYLGYDEAADAIRISEEFEYLTVRDEAAGGSGRRYAPLPPMLALAMEMGFPAAVEGAQVFDSGLVTRYGPYLVAEDTVRYEVTIREMGKYALERRVVSEPEVKAAEKARRLLEREVEAMLERGHLAPWLPVSRNFQFWWRGTSVPFWEPPHCVFAKPGQVLESLAAAIPLLPDVLKQKTLAYLEAERAAYPPEAMAAAPFDKGARREFSRFPEEFMDGVRREHESRSFFAVNKCAPIDALYDLDVYYAAKGDNAELTDCFKEAVENILEPHLGRHDWASLAWFKGRDRFMLFHGGIVSPSYFWYAGDPWYGNGGVLDANAWLKGMIGYVRLARRAGDKEAERQAWGLLGKAFALRYALSKYNLFLYKRGMLPPASEMQDDENNPPDRLVYDHSRPNNPIFIWGFKDEYDHLRQVCVMNEFTLCLLPKLGPRALPPFFRDVCPEIGRFFSDRLKPETVRLVERIEENIPDWFSAYCESIIGGDGMSFMYPHEAHQLFMAKAWVCGEAPERLEHYCDVPWVRVGDLYYIDKLRETVIAYAGCRWQR